MGIALRLVVWGMWVGCREAVVVVVGNVVMVLRSCVPGSILIALPPTKANRPGRPTSSGR